MSNKLYVKVSRTIEFTVEVEVEYDYDERGKFLAVREFNIANADALADAAWESVDYRDKEIVAAVEEAEKADDNRP